MQSSTPGLPDNEAGLALGRLGAAGCTLHGLTAAVLRFGAAELHFGAAEPQCSSALATQGGGANLKVWWPKTRDGLRFGSPSSEPWCSGGSE